MQTFIRLVMFSVLIVFLGISTLMAQFSPGPTVPIPAPGNNGGIAWGDVNGDGVMDLLFRANNMMINSTTAFTPVTNSGIPVSMDAVAMAFADVNGDGKLDLINDNQISGSQFVPQIWLGSGNGIFTQQTTDLGDFATAGTMNMNWAGLAAADIDHTNRLSFAWAGIAPTSPMAFNGGGGVNVGANGGIWLLKQGSDFTWTNVGRGAAPGNSAIDTSRTFEAWNVLFFDATNDGYPDLLMPSFRNNFSKIDTGVSGARKGCILYVNDGTGKFFVPTAATLGRTIFAFDTAGGLVIGNPAKVDTGIIVDDTVRHFEGLTVVAADFNNDGVVDLVFASNGANNWDYNRVAKRVVIVYGKGDGTFTFKWNGTNIVDSGLPDNYARAWCAGDYNNDGYIDILASDATYGLYKNNGNGTFTNVAVPLPSGTLRSITFADYNNDGYPDIYAYTSNVNALLKNNGGSNKWIGFKPIGMGRNLSAIGAVFTVYTGATKQIRTISCSGGASGMGGSLWANFGLGSATKVDSLQVNWPDGTKQTFIMGAANNTLALNKYYTVQEGSIIPAAPTTIRPSWAANDTSLSSTIAMNWHKSATGIGTTTYQIQIASNASFSTIIKTVSGLPDTSTTIRLGLSTKYYWRVQALDNDLQGPYSAIDSFRTQIVACNTTPIQLLPANNSTTVAAIHPKLVVNYVPTASTYHFQLDSSANGFSKTSGFMVNDSTSDFDTTWTISTALKPSKTYYWRVRGYNPAGSSAFSPVDSFTVMYVPAAPILAYPGHNSPNVSAQNLTMKWYSVAGDSNYVVQYWTSGASGLQYTIDSVGRHDTTLVIPALLNRAKYYWHVLAWNQGGTSSYSAIDSFTTVTEVALSPVLVSPKAPTTPGRRATFVWNSALNALKYRLTIATDAFNTVGDTVVNIVVSDTTVQINDTLKASTLYYWRVSSVNLGGEGLPSGAAHFTTSTVVAVEGNIAQLPKEFGLDQNYPNPFNPTTTIGYELPKTSFVKLYIYDVLGRVVATLVDGMQSANRYRVEWNPSHLSSGVYFCRIQARSQDGSADFTSVKKLLYMK